MPSRASRWVVGIGQTLLRALLLLGVMIGWSATGSQGQDGLVHSGDRSAHDVGAACVWVVHRTWFATRHTGVIVINITTVGMTVVPILPLFVGIGRRMNALLLTTTRTAVVHGWLLWESTAVALTANVVLVVVGEHTLLLSRSVGAAWVLANIHAELDVRKLVLHCD